MSANAWGNLRFPPTNPPSDTWQLVASAHGQSPHARLFAAHLGFAKGTEQA